MLSVCLSVGSSVSLSVLDFVIFQKRGFESAISNLPNTTKLILLDSLLQEVSMGALYFCVITMGALDIFLKIQNLFNFRPSWMTLYLGGFKVYGSWMAFSYELTPFELRVLAKIIFWVLLDCFVLY